MTKNWKIVQSPLCFFVCVLFFVATPSTIKVSGFTVELTSHSASAKNGNNGNGNGQNGGNGQGGGNGNGGGNGTRSGGKSETQGNSQGAKDQGPKGNKDAGLSVRHRDGISEFVRNGRYIMTDSKGRTIVNRQATLADEIRLRFLH